MISEDRQKIAETIIALDQEQSRRAFSAFARLAWPYVESSPLRWSWHMGAICEHLEAVSRGQIRDLVIAVPPGHSKSLLVTLWNAWDWLAVEPTRRTISATYAQDLSEKSARILRGLLETEWWRARWPALALDSDVEDRIRMFRVRSKGWRFSTSVGGTVTGYHADILVGDDLAKAQDADGRAALDPIALERANRFWFSTLHTRRADARTTRRVLIGQRLHHDDAPGRAIEAGYTALILPAEFSSRSRCVVRETGFQDPRTVDGDLLCPDRFPAEVIEADRVALGPQGHAAQNNQDPTPPDGMLFKKVLSHRWAPDPRTGDPPLGGRTVITCDAAFKDTRSSDLVAIQAWRGPVAGAFLLLARDTRRMSASETVRALFAMAARFPGAAIYIEDKANGTAIVDFFKAELVGLTPWDPGQASKYSRAEAKAYLFETGRALVPPDSVAPWVADYAATLQRFPLAKHDDDVDATTMALLILDSRSARSYAEAVAKMAEDARGGASRE